MHLLGHQLQNSHRNVPGIVGLQNGCFKKGFLLVNICMCVCVCVLFLSLQSVLFALSFVSVKEKVSCGGHNEKWRI